MLSQNGALRPSKSASGDGDDDEEEDKHDGC